MTAESPNIPGLPHVGEVLAGKYRIERLLGQGGMGAVYAATHEILHQEVAIKLLLPEISENREAVARFLNEARSAARIRNEHVAQVMDVGTLESGAAFMVLELLEGTDLSDLLDNQGPPSVEDAVDYVLQALEAVAQAHALGIIHRDLKPANLFLAKRQDGSSLVKVLDFGISKATNPLQTANAAVTATKALLGSPGYMSPEQVRSSKNVDARTDVWSMGVILYKLLTNRAPFEGDNLGAVFAAILEETPPRVTQLRQEVPAGLDDVVFRCLERDRDKRWSNAAELAQALAPYASPEGQVSIDRVCRTLAVAPPRRSRVSGATEAAAKEPSNPDASGASRVAPAAPVAVVATPGQTAVLADAAAAQRSSAPPAAAAEPAKAPREAVSQGSTDANWAETKTPAKRGPGLAIGIGAGVLVLIAAAGVTLKTMAGGGATTAPSASALPTAAPTPSAATTAPIVSVAPSAPPTPAAPSSAPSAGAATEPAPRPTTAPDPTSSAKPPVKGPQPLKPLPPATTSKPATTGTKPDDSVLHGGRN